MPAQAPIRRYHHRVPEIRVDEHLGRVYGGRYRLVSSVGTGASARVYMAEDTSLRRQVAVKTLHPGLVADEQFRRRFLAEAQLAAQLSHPHVLAVYDWGEHDNEAYLVTELLAGGSLRDMLKAGSRLSSSQALLVGLHSAQGLAAAHERGLVHRDIKPANLLFDTHGRVRIADFGIARAVAEAAWTEPEGALIGTARYAAPEQAAGGEVDGRADVYSLALSLIEAVTGEVPLVSTTPIATMVIRQGTDVVVPDSMGPLQAPLAAAGHADRSQRPTAVQFATMLRAAASEMARPAPLPLVRFTDPSLAEAASSDAVSFDADTEVIDLSEKLADEPTVLFDGDEGLDDTDVYVERPRRLWPLLVALLFAVAGAAGYAGYRYYDSEIRIPTHVVDDYVGSALVDVENDIEVNGWRLTVTEIRRDGTVAGIVLEQSPASGTVLEENQLVTLIVSLGQELRTTPELAGLTVDEATAAITDAGFTVGQIDDTVFDEVVPTGVVLSASLEAGTQAETGTPISLLVSAGPEPRQMPDVTRQAEADATTALEELGFVVLREEAYSDDIAEGLVISATPEVGVALPPGSEVTIVVSLGLPYIEVPDVVGLDAAAAADKLEAAGFSVSDTNGPPNSPVLATDPPAGEFHRTGTSIVIFTRR